MSESAHINADLVQKYFDTDDEIVGRLLELQMTYMHDCQELRESQKRNFKSGVAEGLPKDGFRLELKLHRMRNKHARQIENAVSDEDLEVVESAEAIREALGSFAELPLGRAAVDGAESSTVESAAEAPKAAKARKTKAAANAVKPQGGENTLDAFSDVTGDEPDLRPRFMTEADTERAAENEAAINRGIKELH